MKKNMKKTNEELELEIEKLKKRIQNLKTKHRREINKKNEEIKDLQWSC